MTASTKEVIAAAIYALDPAEDQDLDMDYRPIGKPYPIPWEAIAEFDSPAVKAIEDDATAILAALDAAGYVVVPREPTDEMVVAGDERIIEALNDHTFALRPITPADDAYRAMIAAQESKP